MSMQKVMMMHVELNNRTVEEAIDAVKLVGIGEWLGVTLMGPAGMGKTHIVENTLKELNVKYKKYGGHITLAAIYEYLYENYDQLIFFDDCSNIMQNTEILELMKQALSESHEKRTLHYRSKAKIDAPTEFVFEGRIIMAFNKMDMNPNVLAVLSRAPLKELRYSFNEIIEAMKKIAQHEGGGLLNYEKIIITREIEKYVNPSMEVNLRNQQQAFRAYKGAKKLYGDPPPMDKWKRMVYNIFGKRREVWIREMIKDVVGDDGVMPRQELVKLIAIKKNMTPRNAQRKIAEWIEMGEIFQDKRRNSMIGLKPFHKAVV